MRLDFSSSLDGALTKSDRQPLDIVFVVDVSGSMSSALPDDSDRRSKLAIAQDCMRKIADELKPCDRVGLVSFNDSPSVRLSLQRATTTNIQGLQAAIGGLVCCGGTALAAGLQGGYDVLLNTTNPVTADDSEFRIKRVIFLTDMDSSAQDENAVIALAHQHAAVAVRRHADEAAPGTN